MNVPENLNVKTNDAFLKEKLNNFAKFLECLVSARPRSKRRDDAQAKIGELKTIDTAVFLMHITQDMLPYKKNVRAYVAKMLADDGSSIDELKPPELEKLTLYIEMFIAIVSDN